MKHTCDRDNPKSSNGGGVLKSHYFQNKYVEQSKILSDDEILLYISGKEYNNMCKMTSF